MFLAQGERSRTLLLAWKSARELIEVADTCGGATWLWEKHHISSLPRPQSLAHQAFRRLLGRNLAWGGLALSLAGLVGAASLPVLVLRARRRGARLRPFAA